MTTENYKPKYARLANLAALAVEDSTDQDDQVQRLIGLAMDDLKDHLEQINYVSEDTDNLSRAISAYQDGMPIIARIILAGIHKRPDPNLPPRVDDDDWKPKSMANWFCARYSKRSTEILTPGLWVLRTSLEYGPSTASVENAGGRVLAMLSSEEGNRTDRIFLFPDGTSIRVEAPGRNWYPGWWHGTGLAGIVHKWVVG